MLCAGEKLCKANHMMSSDCCRLQRLSNGEVRQLVSVYPEPQPKRCVVVMRLTDTVYKSRLKCQETMRSQLWVHHGSHLWPTCLQVVKQPK
jgi:hypothetical protein